jgi:TusA-related sulfurtransferase
LDQPFDPDRCAPDHVFDGGDLDCGSGLVLLIREAMQRVEPGGVLEMRSREPTVRDDLPPWCTMVGHELLGSIPAKDDLRAVRYFVRRGTGEAARQEAEALDADRERARAYEWRVRVRAVGDRTAKVYCRNFDFSVGQPASFEESDRNPSSVEYVLGALAADLANGFATACGRQGLDVDDIEVTARGTLHDVLAHLGMGDGDPGFARIDVRAFASSYRDEDAVRATWADVVRRSPTAATLAKACVLEQRLTMI